MEVASEPGASSWLSALPIQEYGFALHKGDFRDALCLCYVGSHVYFHSAVYVANLSM
jgi:hypothetical protein